MIKLGLHQLYTWPVFSFEFYYIILHIEGMFARWRWKLRSFLSSVYDGCERSDISFLLQILLFMQLHWSKMEMQNGYPVEIFAENFDTKFKCNQCRKILREPVQSFCGHRFCKSCIESVVRWVSKLLKFLQ